MTLFTPPIEHRTNAELLTIVGRPKKWREDAVGHAQIELNDRNISQEQINHAKHL